MTALLSVRNLKKQYETKHGLVKAVDDVSFEVPEGKTIALVGESGCGKSSIALSLLRLIPSSGGTVVFDGLDFDNISENDRLKLRQDLSMVFQNPYSSLNPKMRIRDIVAEPLKTCYGLKGKELYDRVDGHLNDVGLGQEHMKRYPHEFSGGQRQRIAIARALALEPRLLILDEPTAALDVSVQAQVLNLLKDLQKKLKLSFLFISHNLATVDYIADEILVMYLGRIVESGPVNQIFEAPAHPYTQALLDSVPSIDPAKRDRLKPLVGDVPSPLNLPDGCAFAPRCDRATDECRKQLPPRTQFSEDRTVACLNPAHKEAS